jgi:hemoglobin
MRMIRSMMGLWLSIGLLAAVPAARAQEAPPVPPAAAAADDAADDLGLEDAAPAAEPTNAATAAPSADPPARDPGAADPAPADPSLRPVLEQFGGREGLVALMDVFMARLLADPRTRPFFAEADQAAVKRHLVEQFCVILGGDCTYTGRDMKTAHAGMGVDRAAFNALVEDLQAAMRERGIPFRAQNKLLARLAPMHREIEGPAAP